MKDFIKDYHLMLHPVVIEHKLTEEELDRLLEYVYDRIEHYWEKEGLPFSRSPSK